MADGSRRWRTMAPRGCALFALFVLAGCATNPEPAPSPSGPSATTIVPTTPKTGDPTPTIAPSPEVAPKPKGNPSRIHQLSDLVTTTLSVKGHAVHAWLMDDEAKQEEGMMFLTDKEVKPDEGMLFAFDSVQATTYPGGQTKGFWMHNTLIPLDIIYMSTQGKVLNIANGKVQDDTTLPAKGPYQYVLEMKAGTAARYGLKPGDTVPIPKL